MQSSSTLSFSSSTPVEQRATVLPRRNQAEDAFHRRISTAGVVLLHLLVPLLFPHSVLGISLCSLHPAVLEAQFREKTTSEEKENVPEWMVISKQPTLHWNGKKDRECEGLVSPVSFVFVIMMFDDFEWRLQPTINRKIGNFTTNLSRGRRRKERFEFVVHQSANG
jgi:hypothetical protein